LSGRKELDKKNILSSEAETSTSFYGVLAGLSFTAAVTIFSFRTTLTSLPLGDVLLTLTLVTASFFIFSAALSASASGNLSFDNSQDAEKCLNLADDFGFVGFSLMIIEIIIIAFYVGWQYGVVVAVAVILSSFYIYQSHIRLTALVRRVRAK
jgi:magnesium-transporting ATPase (P-type)